MSNPYHVLGVDNNATDKEIKTAFRQLSMKYHPDKNPDDPAATAKFQEISSAYDTLSRPDKRQQFDAQSQNPFGGMGGMGGMGKDTTVSGRQCKRPAGRISRGLGPAESSPARKPSPASFSPPSGLCVAPEPVLPDDHDARRSPGPIRHFPPDTSPGVRVVCARLGIAL